MKDKAWRLSDMRLLARVPIRRNQPRRAGTRALKRVITKGRVPKHRISQTSCAKELVQNTVQLKEQSDADTNWTASLNSCVRRSRAPHVLVKVSCTYRKIEVHLQDISMYGTSDTSNWTFRPLYSRGLSPLYPSEKWRCVPEPDRR
jgi:hypothetical protein